MIMLLTVGGMQQPPMADFSRRAQCLVPLYKAGGACYSSECPADVAAVAGRTGWAAAAGEAGAGNNLTMRKLLLLAQPSSAVHSQLCQENKITNKREKYDLKK